MTKAEEIRKLLDDSIYSKTEHVESIGRGMYISGYEYSVKLLWPLIETLNETKPYWMFKRDFDKAMKDLEQKLKGSV